MSTEKQSIIIGVLALQGSYHEHIAHFQSLFKSLSKDDKYSGYLFETRAVKTINDLTNLNALVFPGGESTTMSILLQRNQLLDPIRKLVNIDNLPCWGTCAGLILLCNEITNTNINLGGENIEKSMKYRSIGGLNVSVERNSFGRQVDSFCTKVCLKNFPGDLNNAEFECVFIRAPVIKQILSSKNTNTEVEHDIENKIVRAINLNPGTLLSKPKILLKLNEGLSNESIVAVKQNNIYATSFHPELVRNDYRMHKWFVDEFVLHK